MSTKLSNLYTEFQVPKISNTLNSKIVLTYVKVKNLQGPSSKKIISSLVEREALSSLQTFLFLGRLSTASGKYSEEEGWILSLPPFASSPIFVLCFFFHSFYLVFCCSNQIALPSPPQAHRASRHGTILPSLFYAKSVQSWPSFV